MPLAEVFEPKIQLSYSDITASDCVDPGEPSSLVRTSGAPAESLMI